MSLWSLAIILPLYYSTILTCRFPTVSTDIPSYEAIHGRMPLHYHEIPTFSIIFAEPGLMADTVFILVLLSLRNLWHFPISVLSLPQNCCLRSWASNYVVWYFTSTKVMNEPRASCMRCAMRGMWFLNAGYSMAESTSVYCSLWVIE